MNNERKISMVSKVNSEIVNDKESGSKPTLKKIDSTSTDLQLFKAGDRQTIKKKLRAEI